MGYKQSNRRCNDDDASNWHNQTTYHNLQCLQVQRPQPWLQVFRFLHPIIQYALQYIKCMTYGITYVVLATTASVILPVIIAYSALALTIAFIFYIVYCLHNMIVYLKQESFYKVYWKWMSILIDMFIYYRCMLISKHMPRDLGTVFILYTVYWLLYLKQRAISKVKGHISKTDHGDFDTPSCTSSSCDEECSNTNTTDGTSTSEWRCNDGESGDDSIPLGPYQSPLYYEEENTNLNPRSGLDRVDSSSACEVRCSFIFLMFINTLSKLRSSFCTTTDFNFRS